MRGPFHFFMFSSGPKFFRPISPFVFHIQFLQGDHFHGVISREGSTKISSASLQRSSPIIVTTPTLSALSSPAHASRRATRRGTPRCRRGRRRGPERVELACARIAACRASMPARTAPWPRIGHPRCPCEPGDVAANGTAPSRRRPYRD